MLKIVERFEMTVDRNVLKIIRINQKNDIVVQLIGKNGDAEVSFTKDGIFSTIETGMYHSWVVFDSDADFKATSKKIADLIG